MAFSHQNAFEYFLPIDDEDYHQAYAYKARKNFKKFKVGKAEFLTPGGLINHITSWRKHQDPTKTVFKRCVDVDICRKHIDIIKKTHAKHVIRIA